MYVNEIIKQTSKDRTYIIAILEQLEKGWLIETVQERKQHKQKKFKKLTPLGRELVTIIINVAEFNEYYIRIKKYMDTYYSLKKQISISEKNPIMEDSISKIKSISEDTNFKNINNLDRQIEILSTNESKISYNTESKQFIYDILLLLQQGLIKILLNKHLTFIKDFKVNDTAIQIVNLITTEITHNLLSNIINDLGRRYSNLSIPKAEYHLFNSEPLDYLHQIKLPLPSPTKELMQLINSYIKLLNPEKNSIEKNIHIYNIYYNSKLSYIHQINKYDRTKEEVKRRCKFLIEVYNEYLHSN